VKRTCCISLLLIGLGSTADAREGWGIVGDTRGRVFFTDLPRRIVWRLDADGTREAVVTDTRSHALVSLGDGSVYGTHAHPGEPEGSVWRLDPDGRRHEILPPTRDLPLGLESFLIDTDGTTYSAIRWAPENRVSLLRRRPDGIAERVAQGFGRIRGMAWAPDGAILLADGPFLKRVALDGQVETLGGGPLTTPRWGTSLLGVTTDGSGGAFVADFAGGRIVGVGRHAGVVQEYASNFPWSPAGIARDADGLVVLEHLQMPLALLGDLQVGPYLRVRRLGLKGRVVTLTVLWGTRTPAAAACVAAAAALFVVWRIRAYRR
jgi:sugar lactone lactonase YvrE